MDGSAVIARVDAVQDIYPGADPLVAPDLIVGYAPPFRASWATVLGKMPREEIEDNLDRWSGTHLIAANLIPGILLANRKVMVDDPRMTDIAPTILSAYGISKPAHMTGRALFSDVATTREA